jgi:hypothetical protein
MSKLLEFRDYAVAAAPYNIDPVYLQAVAAVESNGNGFLSDGRIKILFEGHVFWSRLIKAGINPRKCVKGNEDILYPRWTKKFYIGGTAEHDRLDRAARINEMAAYESASWGKFQIMGFNARKLGYSDAMDMAGKFQFHEKEHLKAFMAYVKVNSLIDELQDQDSAGFAYGYNGSGYKANRYDVKIDQAYKRLKRAK